MAVWFVLIIAGSLLLALFLWIVTELIKLGRDIRALRLREDARQAYSLSDGVPVKYYLCAICNNQVLVETDNPRVLRCGRCDRLYKLRDEDELIHIHD